MPNQTSDLDAMYHALGDASRRAMLARLCLGPATVGELAEPLTMALPSVLQHLRVLEGSGLVTTEKVGRVRTCRLVPERLAMAEGWISERRALWEGRLDRLGALLDATADQGDTR